MVYEDASGRCRREVNNFFISDTPLLAKGSSQIRQLAKKYSVTCPIVRLSEVEYEE